MQFHIDEITALRTRISQMQSQQADRAYQYNEDVRQCHCSLCSSSYSVFLRSFKFIAAHMLSSTACCACYPTQPTLGQSGTRLIKHDDDVLSSTACLICGFWHLSVQQYLSVLVCSCKDVLWAPLWD